MSGATIVGLAVVLAGSLQATTPSEPNMLIGAEPTEECAWPAIAAASMGAPPFGGPTCAYTLIHPQLMLTFNQCPSPVVEYVRLGDDMENGPFVELELVEQLGSDSCVNHPDLPVAVCVLSEPVPSIPIPPIMMGCETGLLAEGLDVAMVGFGDTADPPGDDEIIEKRWGMSKLTEVGDELATFALDGPTACDEGDLGSPLYAQYPDGTWHLVGISRESQDCSGNNIYVRVHDVVPWLEETLNVDLTPCHDADGAWAPNDACTEFPLEGPVGTGTWATGCRGAPVGGVSTTCGPAWDADEEEAAPSVQLQTDPSPPELASGAQLAVTAVVNHPVTEVFIEVDGERLDPPDAAWPYEFSAIAFADGEYSVRAIAVGSDDIERASEPVLVRVGEFPTLDETGGTDTEGAGSSGGSDDRGEASEGETGGDDAAGGSTGGDELSGGATGPQPGCACAAGGSAPLHTVVFGAVVLGAIRRRWPAGHRDHGGTASSC